MTYQPLHQSIRSKLDPEYVQLHDEILQNILPSEAKPWDPASRLAPSPMAHGQQKKVEVGTVVDKDLGSFQLRVFTPEGEQPSLGWPVLYWLHGGGWVNGGLNSENGFLRHICKYVGCVVISVNYRHAPEDVYPAAVEDTVSALRWILSPENASELRIDINLLALGGLSAGGNLTAILSLKAALAEGLPALPIFQLLICPVIDNTATTSSAWSESQHSPWLTPSRMTWYRNQYFTKPEQVTNWDASPCFASSELLGKSPKTFICVAECDLLAPEALKYAKQLESAKVDTNVKIYKGATHSVLVLAGIHAIGKQLVHDAATALAEAFGVTYNPKTSPILPQ